jgi:hypothetical protein
MISKITPHRALTYGVTGDTIREELVMTKQEKREQRIGLNPTNVSLQDFENLINQYGRITTCGSHFKAMIGDDKLPYKRENPMKFAYVKNLLKIIDHLQENKHE